MFCVRAGGEVYLGPCQASMMEIFSENLTAYSVKLFYYKTLSWMLDRISNIPLQLLRR